MIKMNHRIWATRLVFKISRQQLADAIGVEYESVRLWEIGKSVPRPEHLTAIAKALRVRENWLLTGEGLPGDKNDLWATEAQNGILAEIQEFVTRHGRFEERAFTDALQRIETDAAGGQPSIGPIFDGIWDFDKQIPIVGTTQAGPDMRWFEAGYPVGYGDGYVDLPAKGPHCYALRVVGNSMAPVIQEGQAVICDPDAAAVPGEEVVVRTTAGAVMVKIFLLSTERHVALGQPQPRRRPRHRPRRRHRAAARCDRGSAGERNQMALTSDHKKLLHHK